MYFYRFILGFSLCTFVFGYEEFENDTKQIALSEEISKLSTIQHFITDTTSYQARINDINAAYSSKIMDGMDKVRLDYETGLLKRHLFSYYFQCSQASFAFQYLRVIDMKLNQKESAKKEVNAMFKLIKDVILKMMAILFNIKYCPPRWMVMLSLISDDLYKKSTTEYPNADYIKHLENYVIADITKIMDTVKDFLNECDSHLAVPEPVSYSMFKTSDAIHEYTADLDRLNELEDAMTTSKEILDYKYHESFKSDQWLINNMMVSNTFFIANQDVMNISWNNIFKTVKAKVNELWSDNANKNAVLETYENPQDMVDIQNLMKNVYRTVVTRHIHLGATMCDDMRAQIRSTQYYGSIKPALRNMATERCKPMITIVNTAIQYLGGDEFFEGIKPLIEDYVNTPMARVSIIHFKTLEQLNYLSSYMGIDAIGTILPKYESLNLLKETNPAVENLYKWISKFFNSALEYTPNISRMFPNLNYKVVEYIQDSVNNKWIHHSNPQ